MKTSAFVCALLIAISVWLVGQSPVPQRTLADYMPAGPLLYLEAKDFAGLVRDWNGSAEKRVWLSSVNHQVFSNSRLFLRLADAHTEFTEAAGIPPDMALLESISGGESALALYDIGQLQFLYITKLPSARALQTMLWQTSSKFEPRNAAGTPYFVRVDPASRRVAAFAVANEYLVLATREDLMAGALTLLAGKPVATVSSERWFNQPVRAAAAPGDLRLVMNLGALVRNPYFRSYWVQRNAPELLQYGAAVSDAHRSSTEIREERVLVRFDEGSGARQVSAASPVMAEVIKLVPDSAGMYRAWIDPSVDTVLQLLERSVLAPQPAQGAMRDTAPLVAQTASAGSEADLEVRIDERPLENGAGRFASAPLRALIEAAKPRAVLELGTTRVVRDGVFVRIESGVALLGGSDWNPEAVRAALATSVETLLTTSGLGVQWAEKKAGQQVYFALDGLAELNCAAKGNLLLITNSDRMMEAVLAKVGAQPASIDATYAAGSRHAGEGPNFARMTRLIDNPLMPASREQADVPESQDPAFRGRSQREPHFFSENISSLSRALAGVRSSSITVRDTGPLVFQTVRYTLAR